MDKLEEAKKIFDAIERMSWLRSEVETKIYDDIFIQGEDWQALKQEYLRKKARDE